MPHSIVIKLSTDIRLTLYADIELTLDVDIEVSANKRKGYGRQKLPCELPIDRIEIDLPEEEKLCLCCHKPRIHVGNMRSSSQHAVLG